VRLLLDTHTALWWLGEPERLRIEARAVLEDPENEVHLSAASVWEVGIKQAAGRLRVDVPLVGAARAAGILELVVDWEHAQRASELPPLHRDPFDRLLVAQATAEELVLLTRDSLVTQYDVATMPA